MKTVDLIRNPLLYSVQKYEVVPQDLGVKISNLTGYMHEKVHTYIRAFGVISK